MLTLRKHYLALVVLMLSGCSAANSLFSDPPYKFPGVAKATVGADGSVSLQWEEVPVDGVKYYVYRKEKGAAFDYSNQLTVLTTNAYTIPAYSIDKQYCFAVRFTKIETIPDDNTTEICPDLPKISGFDGIVAGTSTQTGIADLTWKAPTTGAENVAGYRIYKDAEFKSLALTAKATQTSISIPDLTPEQEYSFGIRLVDKYGREDANTRSVTVFVVNNGMPAFAGLVTAKKSAADAVTLTWPSVDGRLKEFHVYKASGADSATLTIEKETPFKVVSPSALTTTITGLGDELKHCFLVRAATSSGQEDINEVSKCVTLPDNGAPVFSGIKTVEFGQSGANITWDEAVGETKEYRIFYQAGSTINFSTATTVVVTAPATTGTVGGLLDNTTYAFAVRAVDSHNQPDSNTKKVAVTTSDVTPPNFGGYVGIVALDDARIKVTFNRSVEADTSHYSIRYRRNGTTDAYVESGIQTQVGSGTIEHTITGLLPATTYEVLVKAVDSSGNLSTNTATLTRQTLDLLPPSFSGVTAVNAKAGDATRAVATWSAATDAGGVASYFVYYSKASLAGVSLVRTDTYPKTIAGGQVIYITSAVTSGTSTEFAGLDQGQNYYFVAHAVDTTGNEDTNTTQATYSVPYYVAPAAPTALAFNPSPSGPTANQNPAVTGVGTNGNLIRVYVNGTLSANGAINTGTSFSVPITLPGTTGNYTVTVTQVNPSGIEGPTGTAPVYQLLLTHPTAAITGAPTNASTNGFSSIDVTVSNASNVTSYKYALMNFNNIACGNATYSGSWIAVATHITETLSSDGPYRLCVIAKDAADNTQDVTSATQVDWTRDSSAPASATLTGGPATNSNAVNLDVTVSGTNITDYQYVIVQGATSCVGATYSSSIAVATHITAATGTIDEARKLCVVGYNSAGNPQTTPSQITWNRKVALPTISFFEVQDKTTNLGTGTTSPNVKVLFTASGDTTDYCVKTTNSVPSVGDGCWATSNNPAITLSGTTTGSYTIYGWVKDVAGNVSATSSDAITFTNYCDSGDLDHTCAVTTNRVIPAGTTLAGTGSLTLTGGVLQTSAQQTMTINIGGDLLLDATSSIISNVTIVAANVTLNANSVIKADSYGYSGGTDTTSNSAGFGTGGGSGASTANCGNYAAGGTHAGLATTGYTNCPISSTTYGSSSAPTTWGSGGGRASVSYAPGAGGGAVKITASGTLTISSGTEISSKGGSGACNGTYCSGAGAGGSVWLIAGSMAGTGTISAAGGDSVAPSYAGAGGGGRIAIDSNIPFHGTISVLGGSGYSAAVANNAAPGSFYLAKAPCDSGSLSTTCTITGAVRLSPNLAYSGSGSLVVASGGNLFVANSQETISIAMTSAVTVQTGGAINANLSDVTASSFTVEAAATVNANGLGNAGGVLIGAGYSNGAGNGGGLGTGNGTGCNSAGQGGAYGGFGGQGACPSSNTNTYGSATSLTTFGSGGGASSYANGGAGGGYIKLTISGALTVDGTLSVDGAAGGAHGNYPGGGGSGGALIISSSSMAGAGTISAKGGSGGTGSYAAGNGGGGRITLSSATPFHGIISVNAGGSASGSGGAGTYALLTTPCDTGTVNTTCTINGSTLLSYNTNAPTYSGGGSLVIENGGSLYVGNPLETFALSFTQNITVQSGGSILANLTNVTANNFTIDSGGTVSAAGKGYIGSLQNNGTGPGAGMGYPSGLNCNYAAAGGSHAGTSGGYGTCVGSTAVYGSNTAPVTYGSSGGGASSTTGGNGGGAIRLTITTGLVINGTLSVDGSPGSGLTYNAGGGAGGSIWIVSNTLTGSGSITARGGAAGTGSYTGGAGGGGRISITANNPFHGTISVAPGSTGSPGTNGSLYYGSSFCDSGATSTTCTINGYVLIPDGFTFSGGGTLVMANGARFYSMLPTDAMSIAMGGNMTMQSGSDILMNLTSVTAGNFTMDTGSTINLAGRGNQGSFATGTGSGGGTGATGNGQGGGGGAYGGNGGVGCGTIGGGAYFGSKTNPTGFGSAGGGTTYGNYATGGNGGGTARISVTGIMTINGTINADGGSGVMYHGSFGGGGGSGGSIWLTPGSGTTFAGSGTISAKGGDGTSLGGYGGGGGSGGRIAIDGYSVDNFTSNGFFYVNGGLGGGSATAGGTGSLCKNSAGAGCIN